MADAPLQLADVQVSAALTENWGRPTQYFQRYLQDNNRRITASISGVTQALAELAAQQAVLTAQQAQLTAQQAQLTAVVNDLADQQDALSDLIYATVGTYGTVSGVVTDGSGYISYAHGYSSSAYPPLQPCSIAIPFGISPVFHIQDISVSSTNIIFYCTDMAGAPLVSTAIGFTWHVAGA